jgi:hypothetical protein
MHGQQNIKYTTRTLLVLLIFNLNLFYLTSSQHFIHQDILYFKSTYFTYLYFSYCRMGMKGSRVQSDCIKSTAEYGR